MPDGRLVASAIAIASVCLTLTAFADDSPDPALLEFLGATARAEGTGVDVERLVAARLANAGRDEKTNERADEDSEEGDG